MARRLYKRVLISVGRIMFFKQTVVVNFIFQSLIIVRKWDIINVVQIQ